jgi:hypothetical protein
LQEVANSSKKKQIRPRRRSKFVQEEGNYSLQQKAKFPWWKSSFFTRHTPRITTLTTPLPSPLLLSSFACRWGTWDAGRRRSGIVNQWVTHVITWGVWHMK